LADGSRGVVLVNRSGGQVIAQDPSTCRFADMPMATIRTGVANAVLGPSEIGSEIERMLRAVDGGAGVHEWNEPFADADVEIHANADANRHVVGI
ncbi:MAG TPA: chemotaxis protein CheB, partial [Gemmatimonadaceae bacterium]|nr:chemotaxis protein CheB [Gemmatimonadaceae bacterium]